MASGVGMMKQDDTSTEYDPSKYMDEEPNLTDFAFDSYKKNPKFRKEFAGEKQGKKSVHETYHKAWAFPNAEKFLEKVRQVPIFLTQQPRLLAKNHFDKVVLWSYPGSGAELLREYLEQISKILTGSDYPGDTYDAWGNTIEFQGDGKINNKVWIVNSHFPYDTQKQIFDAQRCMVF